MSDWTEAQYNKDLPDKEFKEVLALYRNKIKIPTTKPARQFILCPVGLVGSGKTTVIKPLAEIFNLARVSSDELREILKQKGFNYKRAKELGNLLIKEFLDNGYSVAFDGNCGSEDSQNIINNLEKEYSLVVLWIHINPPEKFIINKLKSYDHTWLFSNSEEAINSYFKYKEKYGDFKNLNLPYIYTFDTSWSDMGEQINEATRKMKEAISII